MEHFANATTVRLRSHHRTCLVADDDEEESVKQEKNGAFRSARWTVEAVPNSLHSIRLKSIHGRYLTASDRSSLPGAGRKVLLTVPSPLDSSIEWKPLPDGSRVKLQSHLGTFLRANGLIRPYKGSVTHGDPKRTLTQESVFWEVDVLEIRNSSPDRKPAAMRSLPVSRGNNLMTRQLRPSVSETPERRHAASAVPSVVDGPPKHESKPPSSESGSASSSPDHSPVRPPKTPLFSRDPSIAEGRMIYYYVADDEGEENLSYPKKRFTFQGSNVQELTRRVEEMTGLRDVILCIRDVINNKLRRLQLQLPPNRKSMTVVAVRSSSEVARTL